MLSQDPGSPVMAGMCTQKPNSLSPKTFVTSLEILSCHRRVSISSFRAGLAVQILPGRHFSDSTA